jgi:hypothetical protein
MVDLIALWLIWGKLAVPWFTTIIVDIKCAMELNVIKGVMYNLINYYYIHSQGRYLYLMDVCKLKVMHVELHGSPLM